MNEQNDNDDEDFATLFAASVQTKRLQNGQTVDGTIVAIGPEAALVDVGAKGEASIAVGELKNDDGVIDVKVGDRIQATIVSTYGGVTLSRRLQRGAATKRQLDDAFRARLPVEGKVESQVKGGYSITVAQQRAFCPASQIDTVRDTDPAAHLGRVYTFRIIEYQEDGRKFVVSRRALLEEERQARAEDVRRALTVGAVVTGRVVSVRDFGAFVDLGAGVQGLLHVSEMGWSRVTDPSLVATPGDEITVKVLRIDSKAGDEKIALGLKQLSDDPWASAERKYPVGQVAQGRVTRIAEFGVFVELEPGVVGLVPRSETTVANDADLKKAFPLGASVDAIVLDVNQSSRRLRLSVTGIRKAEEAAEVRDYAARDDAAGTSALGSLADKLRGALGSRNALLLIALLGPLVWCMPQGFAAGEQVASQTLPRWERGMLDIHQINTGTGDAAFFILPDGTTLLLDAGAGHRVEQVRTRYDAPPRPDGSRRPGQWIARYIRRTHPEGERGELDYAMLTHLHGDHMGTLRPESPTSASGPYRLTGITDVGEAIRIRTMLDRGAPSYDVGAPADNAMVRNYRAFLAWQTEHQGLRSERFVAGRADQIVLRRAPGDFPTFRVRNIAANGQVWTGDGTTTRNRFPEGVVPSENNCSLAFRLDYGGFSYFNGGDMAGVPDAAVAGVSRATEPAWTEMESALAWVTGPVDVHALNHHGTPDAANAFFLSILRPRIHILSTYASSQPGPEVLRRLQSDRVYPGPRDVFMTNWMWPGRRDHMVKLYGEADAAWLVEQLDRIAGHQGHVLVRVEPGGARYRVMVIDDSREDGGVLSVHGPYESRRVASAGAR